MTLPREQMEALRNLMAAEFAAIELNLFLDTHPDDAQALGAFQTACRDAEIQMRNYSERFDPITPCHHEKSGATFQWINPPWPWEIAY